MPRSRVEERELLEHSPAEPETLREVLRHAPFGVIVYEPVDGGEDFRFIFTNPMLESTKPFRSMLGRTYGEAWPEIAHISLPKFREVLRTGEPWVERGLPLEVEVAPGEIGIRYYTYKVVRAFVGGRALLFGFVNDVTREQQIMTAISDARAAAQRELDISSALLRTATELALLDGVEAVAEAVADILLEVLGHSRVSVFLIDFERQQTTVIASRGAEAMSPGTTLGFTPVSDQLEEAVLAGRALVFDFHQLPEGARGPAEQFGSSVVLLAPIQQGRTLLGLITVDDPGSRKEFSERDRAFAEGVASQVGVAIQNARAAEVQRERSARWRLLAELAQLTTSDLEMSQVTERALELAEQELQAMAASVWTLDESHRRLALIASRGFPPEFLEDFGGGIDVASAHPVAQAVAEARPVLFEHIDGEAELYEVVRNAYRRYGIRLRALAAVPLMAHGVVTGAMTLAWSEPRTFDDPFLSFLMTLAERFSLALDNAQLFADQVEQARYAEALNRVNDAIHATLSEHEVLERIVEEMSRVLDVDLTVVQMSREGEREIVYASGVPAPLPKHLGVEKTPLSVLIEQSGEVLVIDDIVSDERARGTVLLDWALRSVIGLPLVIRQQVVGVVFAGRREPRPFSAREVDFGRKAASAASLAVENASLYEAQQRLADRLQEALLSMPEVVEGLEFAHEYRSATAAARVGGDFYDVFQIDDEHVGIAIGDVAGKGLEAAVLTSVVRNLIRANARADGNDPSGVLEIAGEVLYKATAPESFVTVFFGILDCTREVLRYSNAGHTTPIVRAHDGRVVPLGPTGAILGALPATDIDYAEVPFAEGDLLFLYTDGLIEARRNGEFYGEERLFGVLGDVTEPRQAVRAVMSRVLEFTGGELSDDVAVLALLRVAPE